jgi:hypothetical protein
MSFVQQDNQCPICFDDVEMTKNCIITECGHKFHASCLLRSVVHNNLDCPYCRFELVESPEEEDDDENEEDEEDEEEEETMIFYGFRALFQRAEGEEVEPEFDDEDENENDEERDVPLNYIVDEFTNRNYNYNDLVNILLTDFLFKDHDQRSTDILTVLDDLIDSYEAPIVQITNNDVIVIDLTGEEDDTNDTDSEASSDSVIFVPKINFNIVKRYQATSELCGNN